MPDNFRITRRSAIGFMVATALTPLAMSKAHRQALAEAPMLGAARPQFYRFRLGAFEVTTLFDGALEFDGPHPIFGENRSAEEVGDVAEANFLPREGMEIAFTPILVNTGAQVVLFDTGNPAQRGPGAANLVAALQAAGYEPEMVDVVAITHMHPDHIGGLMREGEPVFSNARYVTAETEYDFWSREERLSGPTEGVARLVQSHVAPLAEKMTFLKEESEVVPGIRAVAAFGHTPGHMAFHIESEGERLLNWADTANHYVLSVQRPDWHVRFDMDKEAAIATRKRLLDFAAAERLPVAGYHMPFPALGYIDARNEGYRWVPVSYQLQL